MMSRPPRRALTIDDPVGGRDACHVARPLAPGEADGRLPQVPVSLIHPNASQPRQHFDEQSLSALADSIRERGMLVPIIVRPISSGEFEIVAGERRWRAAQQVGQPTIPALIDGSLDGADALELALIQNVVREDLTPIEEARTIAVLLRDVKITATRLATQLGRSRTDVAHTVRLLDLPQEAIELIDTGALSKGHGKALLTEPDHHRRRILARRAADAGWSVRALEAEIARPAKRRPNPPEPHPDHEAAAGRLQDMIATAIGGDVSARPYRDGYQVVLDQAAGDRLTQLLGATSTLKRAPVPRATP
jgi:ParB family transcriptional regulator, chromosome partitioning protein